MSFHLGVVQATRTVLVVPESREEAVRISGGIDGFGGAHT